MEAIVEYYQNLLQDEKSPGILLAKFFSELFSLPTSKEQIIMMNKLVRLYGRQATFEAILESYISGADVDRIFGLLNYICKRKIGEKPPQSVNLANYAKEFDKKLEVAKKLKIRNPFDD